jgi:hypothetical protein
MVMTPIEKRLLLAARDVVWAADPSLRTMGQAEKIAEAILAEYKKLGIDPANPNPDGSDYHLMNAVDDEHLKHDRFKLTEKWALRRTKSNYWTIQYMGMDWLKIEEFLAGVGVSTIDVEMEKFVAALTARLKK